MFAAVAGLSAEKSTVDGVSKTGCDWLTWSTTLRLSVVSAGTCVTFGGGEFGSGRLCPPGVNDAPVICGAVLSMRKLSSSDDERPGKGGVSTCPTTTACTCWKPSGKTPGTVNEKAPLASVATTRS